MFKEKTYRLYIYVGVAPYFSKHLEPLQDLVQL